MTTGGTKMKLDDIKDEKLRTEMANLQLAYWDECTKEAARIHPNWHVTGEHSLKHNGKRTGPQKPRTLLNWFLANHPDKAGQIRDRLAAMLRFSGEVTTKRNARH
jgi:hypothetical protein